MEIKKIEEGMTGRQVADLLYENFKTIDDNKASSELQNTVDTLIEDLEELQNRIEEVNADIPTIRVGNVTFVKGIEPDVENTGTERDIVLDFVLPAANELHVGTVKTLSPTEKAYVNNSGTPYDAVFNFGIPRGLKGDKGNKGDGLQISGFADTEEDLPKEGALGDTYVVGTTLPYSVYMHNGTNFINVGTITELKSDIYDGGRADTNYGGARIINCGGADNNIL